jgi:iron complex transport system substrate-binding protein
MAHVGFQSLPDSSLLLKGRQSYGRWFVGVSFLCLLLVQRADAQRRVVSLAPSLTETVDALGAVDSLVGVSSFCEFPEVVRALPRVGGLMDPSLETIVRLKPDLLLALESHSGLIAKLAPFSIPILVVNNTSIEEIKDSYIQLGKALGREKEAVFLKRQLEKTVEVFRREAMERRPRVITLLGQMSITKDVVAGKDTLFDEIVSLCGGSNVVAKKGYGVLSVEEFVRLKPDQLIIISSEGESVSANSVRSRFQTELRRLGLGNVNFDVLDQKYLVTPGARVHKSIEQICSVIRRGA